MCALVGQRVVRGPDWKWGAQDGGAGHLGTVVAVDEKRPPLVAAVCWDAGGAPANYRVGAEGAYDLRTYDNAPSGVRHRGYVCDVCNTTDIAGFRFRCSVCFDSAFDLCTECYMTDQHEKGHAFFRYTCAEPNRVLLPPRSGSAKMQAFGTLPGAAVVRGPDWAYGDQDGGAGTAGVVRTVVDGGGSGAARDAVEVVWAGAGPIRTYRVGRDGKVDVLSSASAGGSYYYPDHLPAVGCCRESFHSADAAGTPASTPLPSSQSLSSTSSSTTAEFSVGDMVRRTTTAISQGSGSASAEVQPVTEIGLVEQVCASGEITVDYGGRRPKLIHDPGQLMKVEPFRESDAVMIIDDEEHLRACLEEQATDRKVDVTQVLSREAVVVRRCDGGRLEVRASDGSAWILHPSCLVRRLADRAPSDSANRHDHSVVSDVGRAVSPAQDSGSAPGRSSVTRASDKSCSENEGLRPSEAARTGTGGGSSTGGAAASASGLLGAAASGLGASPEQQLLASLTSGIGGLLSELTQSLLSGQGPAILQHMELQNAIMMQQVSDVWRILQRSPTLVNVKVANITPLLMACFVSNVEIIQLLLEAGANVTAAFDMNITPLLVCVMRNSADCVRLLMKHGASASVVDSQGMTPLQRAVHEGKVSCISAMVEQGCDVNVQNASGNSAVHDASSAEDASVAAAVLSCPTADLAAKNAAGRNALHLASAAGNSQVVRLILASTRRASVDEKTTGGLTALQLAAERGHANVLEILIAEGKANFENPVAAAASVGCIGGETPLFLAVAHAHWSVVDVLVRHGASICSQNAAGDTCLHVLVAKLQLLAGAGARAPPPPPSSLKLLRQLLEAGADVTCRNAKNKSSLDLASNPHIRQLLEQFKDRRPYGSRRWRSKMVAGADERAILLLIGRSSLDLLTIGALVLKVDGRLRYSFPLFSFWNLYCKFI